MDPCLSHMYRPALWDICMWTVEVLWRSLALSLALFQYVHGSIFREGWHLFNCVVATIRRCYSNAVYLQTLTSFNHQSSPVSTSRTKTSVDFFAPATTEDPVEGCVHAGKPHQNVVEDFTLTHERHCNHHRQSDISLKMWFSPVIHFSYARGTGDVSIAEVSVEASTSLLRAPLSGRFCYYAQSV